MDAPIDIVISIIKRHIAEVNKDSENLLPDYKGGMLDAYEGLIEEFEGFKKLFN